MTKWGQHYWWLITTQKVTLSMNDASWKCDSLFRKTWLQWCLRTFRELFPLPMTVPEINNEKTKDLQEQKFSQVFYAFKSSTVPSCGGSLNATCHEFSLVWSFLCVSWTTSCFILFFSLCVLFLILLSHYLSSFCLPCYHFLFYVVIFYLCVPVICACEVFPGLFCNVLLLVFPAFVCV